MADNRVELRSMDPVQMQQAIARSDLIWQPEVHDPHFGLAIIQHLVRGGALYGDEDLDSIAAPHFGDGFLWTHFSEVWGMFKFRQKAVDAVDVLMAGLISMLFCLRAILGTEGAFRFWCAIFEAANSGVKVQFPSKKEGVAVLKRERADLSPGWDAWHPDYQLYALRKLEEARDVQGTQAYMTYAASTHGESFVRVAADGFVRLAHELPAGRSKGQLEAFGDITDSLALRIIKKNPGLADKSLTPMGSPHNATYAQYFGGAGVRPERGARWAQAQINLRRAYGSPSYPIDGGGLSDIDKLVPNQRYGARRDVDGDGSIDMTHRGLDLPFEMGTSVRALYRGEVKWSQKAWKKGGGPRGNHVILEHEIDVNGSKRSILTEYYHLSDVTVKPGDTVGAGETIGTVGTTGNSTGPHLHLVVRVADRDDLGRSAERMTLDPEVVLRDGLAAALAASGSPIASGKPNLALGSIVLMGAGIPSGASYMRPSQAAAFDSLTRERMGPTMTKEAATALLRTNHAAGSPFDPSAYGGWFDDALDYTAAGLKAGISLVVGEKKATEILQTLDSIAASGPMQKALEFLTTGPGGQFLRSRWTAAGLPGGAVLEETHRWMGEEYQRQLLRSQGNAALAKAGTVQAARAKFTADPALDEAQTAQAIETLSTVVQSLT